MPIKGKTTSKASFADFTVIRYQELYWLFCVYYFLYAGPFLNKDPGPAFAFYIGCPVGLFEWAAAPDTLIHSQSPLVSLVPG